MKKHVIWLLSIVIGLSCIALLVLQVRYINEMRSMRRQQFEESVQRSLYATAHNLEVYETMDYLEKDAIQTERNAQRSQMGGESHELNIQMRDGRVSAFEFHSITLPPKPQQGQGQGQGQVKSDAAIPQVSQSLQDIIRKRYANQRALMDEVIYNILYTASNKPLGQRINFQRLDRDLQTELLNNGITLNYHFSVSTSDGRMVYSCPDYEEKRHGITYSQILFRNDPPNRMGILKIHFPDANAYMFSTIRYVIPAIIFTLILMVTFSYAIWIISRQKKVTEVKNDFINNMTHELKTPISTISLAAQMLGDSGVTKSPEMARHISGVINDETKRLRLLVEKVLQMSMFDRQNTSLKLRDLDANEVIAGVVHTFELKAKKYGGLTASLKASDPIVAADEMHFTNVIFNLLDNAVKYRREDVPLELEVSTWNDGGKLCIAVKDNGIGIKKENLKHIFDRFYRVHTGNQHDVKGFGLGLAYVKKIVTDLKGTIRAESELGTGTTFIITLPLLEGTK